MRSLTPAYDLPGTRPYGDRHLALMFDGRNDNLKRAGLIAFGARSSIPARAIESMLDRLVELARPFVSRVKEIGLDVRLTKLLAELIKTRLADLEADRRPAFEHHRPGAKRNRLRSSSSPARRRAMGLRSTAALAVISLLAAGCTATRTQVQMDREPSTFRSPVMQTEMAKVVDKAVQGQDFAALSGKTAVVEVNGLFPQTSTDLLAFVKTAIEAKASQQGVRVVAAVPCTPTGAVGALSPSSEAVTPLCIPTTLPDYRIVVSVEVGGVERTVRRELRVGKLIGQLAITGAVPLTALALGVVFIGAFIYFAPVAAAFLVAGAAWMILSPPTEDFVRLRSKAQLLVHRLPREGGGISVRSDGGHSDIELRPDDSEGFEAEDPIPTRVFQFRH
jgi:hypothetical protein